MDNQDRELILGLAERLREAQPAQKDPQAAELIAQSVARQPDALYLLVQAVLVQEDALRTAQARIGQLQAARPAPTAFAAPPAASAAPAGGGFMSGVFGRNPGSAQSQQGSSGGGFLKTAAAAAAGVAGGALLFQGLNEVFGGHDGEAHGEREWQDQDEGFEDDGRW